MSDDEWRSEIFESFRRSGLVPSVLRAAPGGLVNVNFGTHNCVHMGTAIETEVAAYEPSAVSWPAGDGEEEEEEAREHTLVMFDADGDGGHRVHWLVVNVAGSRISEGGDTIVEYDSPTPGAGEGPHRSAE